MTMDAHIGQVDATVRTVDAIPLSDAELDRVVREVMHRMAGGSAGRHEGDTSMRNSVMGPQYITGEPGGGGA
jgi:hypothetical protein